MDMKSTASSGSRGFIGLIIFLLPIFLLLGGLSILFGKTEPGCVAEDEFGSNSVTVDAREGQWTETYLLSNGNQIIANITGAWTAWNGSKAVSELRRVNLGYKKNGVGNLICREGEVSVRESNNLNGDRNGEVNCVTELEQADPNFCTCTNFEGTVLDDDIYIISLDELKKDESVKEPDDQEITKYTGGLGLKIALFGADGLTVPQRAYDLNCNLQHGDECEADLLDGFGNLSDDSGRVYGKYCDSHYSSYDHFKTRLNNRKTNKDDELNIKCIYRSPNDEIFLKNDREYHEAREQIKLKIEDSEYSDNDGYYKVEFVAGVMVMGETGLLEDLVGIIEKYLVGDPSVSDTSIYSDDVNYDNSDYYGGGKGVLEYFYNILVKDSIFRDILQISLILYITFFGISILTGAIKIEKKELMDRIVTIAFVMFFADSNSWYWYDKIIVSFFNDGMDSLIIMFMSIIADIGIADGTTLGIIAQEGIKEGTTQATSYASRFAYIDVLIKSLFEVKTHTKIWSLLFSESLAIIYIPLIYCLIFYFCYVMVLVAAFYVTALLKLIFALAIGPIFILFLLFKETKDNFKKWVSFLAGRSLEILIIFIVTYVCVLMIHENFTELFWYKTCAETFKLFFFINFDVQVAQDNKSDTEWFSLILETGAILFLLQMLLNQLGNVIADLIDISGMITPVGSATTGSGGLYGNLSALASSGAKSLRSNASDLVSAVGERAARASGLKKSLASSSLFHAVGSRDDSVINKARDKGLKQNLTGKKLDTFMRKELGASGMDKVKDRYHHRFVTEPLQQQAKKKAKELRGKGLFGRELQKQLKKDLESWSDKNLVIGKDGTKADIEKALGSNKSGGIKHMLQQSMSSAINPVLEYAKFSSNIVGAKEMEGRIDNMMSGVDNKLNSNKIDHLSINDAAKKFANHPDKQNEYIKHLKRAGKQDEVDKFIRKADWQAKENRATPKKGYINRKLGKYSWNEEKNFADRFEFLSKKVDEKTRNQYFNERDNVKDNYDNIIKNRLNEIRDDLNEELIAEGYREGLDGKKLMPAGGLYKSKKDILEKYQDQVDKLKGRIGEGGGIESMEKEEDKNKKKMSDEINRDIVAADGAREELENFKEAIRLDDDKAQKDFIDKMEILKSDHLISEEAAAAKEAEEAAAKEERKRVKANRILAEINGLNSQINALQSKIRNSNDSDEQVNFQGQITALQAKIDTATSKLND